MPPGCASLMRLRIIAAAPQRQRAARTQRAPHHATHRAAALRVHAAADAEQQLVLITGANTGLGKQAALALSRRGMRVIGACRSLERGEAAARDLAAGGGAMEVMQLDLASFASVRAFAAAFRCACGRVGASVFAAR